MKEIWSIQLFLEDYILIKILLVAALDWKSIFLKIILSLEVSPWVLEFIIKWKSMNVLYLKEPTLFYNLLFLYML